MCVGGREPPRNLSGEVQRLVLRQWSALDLLPDRLALVERHRDERAAAFRLADLVDRADVRMIQRGRGPGLAEKPFPDAWMIGPVGREELEDHTPAQIRILGQVEHAHAASPEAFPNSVAGDRLPYEVFGFPGEAVTARWCERLQARVAHELLERIQDGVGLRKGVQQGRHGRVELRVTVRQNSEMRYALLGLESEKLIEHGERFLAALGPHNLLSSSRLEAPEPARLEPS